MIQSFKTSIIIFFLILTNFTFAQNKCEDIVYLKNGSVIRGLIIEQTANKSLKIQTNDRNVFVYSFEEIDKITKDCTSNDTIDFSLRNKSFIILSELVFNSGYEKNNYNNQLLPSHCFGLKAVFAYKIKPNLSLGIGLGAYGLDERIIVPITIDARMELSTSKTRPIINANIGYAYEGCPYLDLVFNPSIGFKHNTSKKHSYLFSIGYQWQEGHSSIETPRDQLIYKYVTINSGFIF